MHKKYEWTADRVALLGTDTDKEIAKKLGIHRVTVRMRRRSLGIARYYAYKDLPLGKVSDAAIARAKGVTVSAVAQQRRRYGIPAAQKQTPWTAAHVALLGTDTDKEVGRMVGRNAMAVYIARRTRGIPAYGKSRLPV